MKIRVGEDTWWMVTAGIIGVLMVMLGIGNLLSPDDTGPLYGKVALLAVMATGAGLIVSGLVIGRTDRVKGNKFVGLGVLPGSVGLAFFWFPPAVAVGVVAIITSWQAFRSAERSVERPAHV